VRVARATPRVVWAGQGRAPGAWAETMACPPPRKGCPRQVAGQRAAAARLRMPFVTPLSVGKRPGNTHNRANNAHEHMRTRATTSINRWKVYCRKPAQGPGQTANAKGTTEPMHMQTQPCPTKSTTQAAHAAEGQRSSQRTSSWELPSESAPEPESESAPASASCSATAATTEGALGATTAAMVTRPPCEM
jgi:hypothetical protein